MSDTAKPASAYTTLVKRQEVTYETWGSVCRADKTGELYVILEGTASCRMMHVTMARELRDWLIDNVP